MEAIKKGYEVEYLSSENKTESGLVSYVNDKKFGVRVLKYSKHNNEFYTVTLHFFLSGKKTSRHHTNGDVIRIANKW